MRGKALRERVETVATQCGLPLQLLTRFPHQLSGGQRARVGIARAIAVEPDLLVLDEPTAALDVSVQVVILQLLQRLKKEFGMSYLFVSHDLSVVKLLCDRVLVMYLGKIVESGPAMEVFEHPLHPYTQALVAAVPRFGEDGDARLRLSGEPRSPIDPDPNVCRFYGRCPRGTNACKTAMPVLRRFGAHHVACHYAEDFCPAQPSRKPRHETQSRTQSEIRARRAKSERRKSRVAKAPRLPKRRPKSRRATDAVDVLVAASAQALGLTLDPAWQAGVKFNLQLILRHAALVDEFPLPDDAEPAPVFHA